MKFNLFGHSWDVREILKDVFHILLLGAGALGINVEKYVAGINQLVGYAQADFSMVHGMGWGLVAVALIRVIYNNATPIKPSETPSITTAPNVTVNGPAKAGLFLLAFLLCGSAFSQTMLDYSGGLNFNRQTVTGPTNGFYSFPLIGTSASPLEYNNGSLTLGAQAGLSLCYVFGEGTMTPDGGKTGYNFTSNGWLFGGDYLQTTNTSDIGPCIYNLGISSNFGLALLQPIGEKWDPAPFVNFTTSFDIVGVPVIKWH